MQQTAYARYLRALRTGVFIVVAALLAASGPAWAAINVSLGSNGTTFTAPASVTLTATVTGGAVTKVMFYANGDYLDQRFSGIYTLPLSNVPANTYQVHAVAVDANNQTYKSNPVTVTVHRPPTLPTVNVQALTSSLNYPGDYVVAANASGGEANGVSGTIEKVEFILSRIDTGRVVQTVPDYSAPYGASFSNIAVGEHIVTATVYAKIGAAATQSSSHSTPRFTIKAVNPSVQITAPAGGTNFPLGHGILIKTTTNDGGLPIKRVEFYQGSTKQGEVSAPPYEYNWYNAPLGTHTLKAKIYTDAGSSESGSFTIHVVPPLKVTLTKPTAGTKVAKQPHNLDLAATTTGNGIKSVVFFVRSVGQPDSIIGFANTNGTGNYATSVLLKGTPAGPVQLYAVAKDGTDGNGTTLATSDLVNGIVSNVSPKVTASVTPSNEAGTILLNGSASDTLDEAGNPTGQGQVVKLEAFVRTATDSYGSTPVKSVTGTDGTLSFTGHVFSGNPGNYYLEVRATDNQASTTKHEIPFTLGTGNAGSVQGVIDGVYRDAGNIYLRGWACETGINSAIQVRIFGQQPYGQANSILIGSGTANLSNETRDDSNTRCGTSIGHRFKIDITAANTAGKIPLYVYGQRSGNGELKALSCGASNCLMPGALNLGFTTPEDNARISTGSLGADLFLRVKVTGKDAGATIDKVEFTVEGEVLVGVADTEADTYVARKTGLLARTAPYLVSASVTSGGVKVNATARQVYVDAGGSNASVSLTSPLSGSQYIQGTTISLQAKLGSGTVNVQKVAFFGGSDGTTWLAETSSFVAGADGSRVASLNWTTAALGSHKIIAKAYNGTTVVGTSGTAGSAITVVSSNGGEIEDGKIAVSVGAELDKYLNNADAGTLPGELGSNDGVATYALPIAVPPGTASMAPTLSLSYSSRSANGMAGLGWNLGGFSSIHRCETTIAQDGVAGRITYSTADRLCLDGQRLVRINGSNSNQGDSATQDAAYWANDAEYRTELESFQRITRYSANGRNGFKVETKAGQTLYYGVDGLNGQAASYVMAQGRQDGAAVSWAIDRREDTMGNRMVFEYEFDATRGEHRPKQIRYGANANSSASADLAVRFGYEARPDIQNGYYGGSKSDQTKRLKTITTAINTDDNGTGGTVGSVYTLEYDQSGSTGRSLLKSVEQCAPGRTPGEIMACLPKTTFAWGQSSELRFRLVKEVAELAVPPQQGLKLWGVNSPKQGYFEGGSKPNKILFERDERCTPGFCDPDHPVPPEEMSTIKFFTGKYRILLSDGRTVEGQLPFDGILSPEEVNSIATGSIDGSARDGLWLQRSQLSGPEAGPLTTTVVVGYCAAKDDAIDGVRFECQRADSLLQVPRNTEVRLSSYDQFSLGKANLSVVSNSGIRQACVLHNGHWQCQPYKKVVNLPLPQGSPLGNISGGDNAISDRFVTNNFNRGEVSDLFSVSIRNTPATFERLGYVRICLNKADWECHIVMGHRHNETSTLGQYVGAGSIGDLSGDGLADFAFYDGDQQTYVCLNTEASADCFAAGEGWGYGNRGAGGSTQFAAGIGDFEGSGQASLLIAHRATDSRDVPTMRLCRLNDRALVCRPIDGGLPSLEKHYPAEVYVDPENTVPGIILRPIAVGEGPFTSKVYTLASVPGLDRIISVTNGLNQTDKVTYAHADDSETYQRLIKDQTGRMVWPAYPQQIGQPGVMVKTIERDNGVAGKRTVQHRYEQVLRDAAGRRNLGFAMQSMVDLQSGITTTTSYEQTWPMVGMVKQTVMSTGTGNVLYNLVNTPTFRAIPHANQSSTWFAHVSNTVTAKKDLDGSNLGNTTQSFQFDDWGNLTRHESTSKASDNKAYTTLSVNTYKSANAGDAPWRFGLLDTSTVTNTLFDGRVQTRSKAFTYDSYGLLKTETVEPEEVKLRLVTTLDRSGNAFGLINSKTLSWVNPLTGNAESRMVEATRYDSRGRYAESVRNALGHTETRVVDARTGTLTSLTGPNGLTTIWQVDGLGRKQKEIRADGTETRLYSKFCETDCPAGLNATLVSWSDRFKGVERIAVPTLAFSDNEGHVLRTQGWGFDGSTVYTDSRYDSRGRLWEVDQPRFANASAFLASRKRYDDLDRVVAVTTLDAQGVERTATTTYAGLVVTDTNAKQQTRVAQRNVLGQLVQVIDAKHGVTTYGHDPFGNLDRVTDPAGNVVKIVYDRLGRKTDLYDPNLGWIHYDVDPVGQVLRQISPKQRKAALGKPAAQQELHYTRFQFDVLGRMTARLEPDLTSRWVYDQADGTPAGSGDNLACTARKSCGQLVEAFTLSGQAKDYSRSQSYDSLGRPSRSETLLGSDRYSRETQYDNWGRVAVSRQQRSNQAIKQYEQRYNAYGYLARIVRGNVVLWRAQAQDAANRVLEAGLGGVLTQRQTYNPYTGLPDDATLKNSLNQTVLFEDYQYDVLGNLSQRSQHWLDHAGFSELFGYDDLNRLESAQVIGKSAQVFQYNAIGNLLSKTGVGTGSYEYPGITADPVVAITRPNAVTSIPGYGSFGYDDNGNLESVTKLDGQGSRSLSWTSFDMPNQPNSGTSSFAKNSLACLDGVSCTIMARQIMATQAASAGIAGGLGGNNRPGDLLGAGVGLSIAASLSSSLSKLTDAISSASASDDKVDTLYHYTTAVGQEGILYSQAIKPSLKAVNPNDARYGDGQYFTNIPPEAIGAWKKAELTSSQVSQGLISMGQLSSQLYGVSWMSGKMTNYIEVNVSGLNVINPAPGKYLIPNQVPLDISGRVVRFGKTAPN